MLNYIRQITADLNALSVRTSNPKLQQLAISAGVIGQLVASNQIVLLSNKEHVLALIAVVSRQLQNVDINFEVPTWTVYDIQIQITPELCQHVLHFVDSDVEILKQIDSSRKTEFEILLGA